MSEKRFEVGYDDESNPLYVYDNTNDNTYNIPRIVDLLNYQQSIIKHLTIEKHQADKRFQTIIAELKKENERLKSRNSYNVEDMQMEIGELKEENEQLKEEIRAYPINEQYAEEIIQQNQKLRIERYDLRRENEQLRQEIVHLKDDLQYYKTKSAILEEELLSTRGCMYE